MKKLYIVSRLQRTILWKEIGLVALVMILAINICHAESESKPAAIHSHSAVYDSENRQMIIFGGSNKGNYFSNTWIFNIEKRTWKEVKVEKRPPSREGHSAVYDSTNKYLLIFGGVGQRRMKPFSDTWVFDIEKKTWEWIKTKKVPPPRENHSAVYDSANKQMLIFGGNSNMGLLSDLWAYDIDKKTWQEIETDEAPPARYSHSAIYDPVNKQMIIFSGRNSTKGKGNLLYDLWIYDIEKKKWKEIETEEVPTARSDHTAVYDEKNKQMIIFGGRDYGKGFFLSDTWIFDIEKKKCTEIKTDKTPLERIDHGAIYDSINKQMILFGGMAPSVKGLSDMWIFDIEKKTWKEVK